MTNKDFVVSTIEKLSLNTEELAYFLSWFCKCSHCPNNDKCGYDGDGSHDCLDCWIDWLEEVR